MRSQSPLLEGQHLARCHPDGQRWLLDDVSLEIQPGDTVGVLGPSGAGKTLLLRALALLDPLDRGEVCWQGQVVRRDRVPDYRARVVYLHQRTALTGPTVADALRQPFALRTHRHRIFDRDWAVARLAELGRDASFLDKLVRDLSGGETQMTALLRALALEPAVLLLDEPTAAMDPAATAAAEALVAHWVAEPAGPRAMLWVSHDADQTARMVRRTVSLREGRALEFGIRNAES